MPHITDTLISRATSEHSPAGRSIDALHRANIKPLARPFAQSLMPTRLRRCALRLQRPGYA